MSASKTIADRLKELGITLPKAAAPVASYQPLVVQGNQCYLSGQLPFVDGELVTGKLGTDVTLERGQEAARACGLMILAQLEAHDLMAEVFGENGKHARSAVGVPVLPLNAAVEVDAVLALSGA